MDLHNVKALITGGSSGIGLATAQAIIEAGGQVVIAGRNPAKLKDATDTTGAFGIRGDVTQLPDVTRIVKSATERMQGLNVLVNNAGFGYFSSLIDIDPRKFEEVWRTNVFGAMLCGQACAKTFIAQGYGTIINVGSTAAIRGSASVSPYNATKFALRGMTESWRKELRSQNVRVMLVNPSEVMTSFMNVAHAASGSSDTKQYSEAEQRTKLRGEEIASAIVSLIGLDDRALIPELEVWSTNPSE